ncbi:MAG: gluconate 2-dehydrogenase subunit 3 family protein [Thermodesulfobacteriota bacterium]
MINSRRKFLKTLAIGFIGGKVVSSFPGSAFATNLDKGIEIQKGYIVFNEDTQKVMQALAEGLVPGSKEIDIKSKVMNYVNRDRAAATFLDAGFWNINSISKSKYKKSFYALTEKNEINSLIEYVKVKNSIFFNQFRSLIIRLYYSDPIVWKKLSYSGPPQTKGFMDYAEPPKQSKKPTTK